MHARDAAGASERIHRSSREVSLEGPMSEDRVARPMEIAERRPVRRAPGSGAPAETAMRPRVAAAAR